MACLPAAPFGPGLSTLAWSAVVGFVAAQGMEPLVQFYCGLGLLDTLGHVVGAGATVSVAAAVVGAARLLQREPRSARYGPVILLLLMIHLGWHQLLQRGDEAALLAVLEVRMVEAAEVVDLLSVVAYGAAALAVAWVAWELRALWRAHRHTPADRPSPAHDDDDLDPRPDPPTTPSPRRPLHPLSGLARGRTATARRRQPRQLQPAALDRKEGAG